MPRKKTLETEIVLEETPDGVTLPEGWRLVKLGEVCSHPQYGYTTKASDRGAIKLLRTTDITSGCLNWNTVPYCSEPPSEVEKYQLYDGDILISRAGSIGVSYLIRNPEKAVFASYLIRFKPLTDLILSDFMLYFLQSPYYWNIVNGLSMGIAIPNINASKLSEILIPLPPLPTQQKIVAKIEALFSELDAGVEKLKAAQQQLKVYRQAVLKAAFEGKLTHKNLNGKLPESWKIYHIGQLMESVKNGYSKKPLNDGEYKILRISSVRPNYIDFSDIRYINLNIGDDNIICENDILFTRYNGSLDFVGICARVPFVTESFFYPDKLIRCRPKLKYDFHSKYISYAANQGESRKFVLDRLKTTAGQKGIAGAEIKLIPIPLAPIEEQQSIVTAIETRLTACEAMEKEIEVQLSNAAQLRQSILKKAFSGELIA